MCGQTLGSQTRLGPKSVRIKVEQEGSRSVGKVKGLPRGYREREIGKSPFGVWLGRALSGDVTRLRLRLRIASALSRLGGTQLIANVRVPKALLPEGAADGCITDAEGLVACDVSIQHGRITSVVPAADRGATGTSLLLPCWVDCHTHLVKTHTVPRNRNPTGSINGALACELDDQPRWCVEDVSRRMGFALRTAYHHGTRAIRSHLDGTNSDDAKLRDAVYAAFDAARTEWAPRGLELQGVANLYLPLYADEVLARRHVEQAAAHEGVVLGAYCGNVATTPSAETERAFDALFAHARVAGLAVDLHIDETNDPQCCALRPLIASLRRARASGYSLPVVLGHCCSLGLQPTAARDEIINGLASLQPVTVVCNPHTNLGLQDRRGSAPPHCAAVDEMVARTPAWRGLAPVQELRAGGVPVAAASDNVRDWWHPYGDYDGLSVWQHAMTLAQLDTAPSEGDWACLVTDGAARAMALNGAACHKAFARGARADLILFPSARNLSELFSRPQADRIVLRAGVPQSSALPAYTELDDLVAEPTRRSGPGGQVQRGATKQVIMNEN